MVDTHDTQSTQQAPVDGDLRRATRGRLRMHRVPTLDPSPVPYVLRHTFASNALAAGVGTFELARYMGTSVEMIERTYGHLVTGADDAFRARLDAFAAARVCVNRASAEEVGGR